MIIVNESPGPKVEKTRQDRYKWTRNFTCIGVPDVPTLQAELIAYMEIRTYIVLNYPVLTEQLIQSLEVTEVAPGTWTGQCIFMSPTIAQLLKTEYLLDYSFSTKGGTAHIDHGRKTVKRYAGYKAVYDEITTEEEQVYDMENATYVTKPKTTRFEPRRDSRGQLVVERETIPELNGGIGWNQESANFDGIDIEVSSWKSTASITVPDEYVNGYYLRMLRLLTGTVNSTPFDGMNPGECLFIGCDGQRQPVEVQSSEDSESTLPTFKFEWKLTFEFIGAPNIRRWIDGIGYIEKDGWDILHILRKTVDYPTSELAIPEKPIDPDPPVTDADSNVEPTDDQPTPPPTQTQTKFTTTAPLAAYVEQVYPRADFRVLGIYTNH
jgi:hypothetical protein